MEMGFIANVFLVDSVDLDSFRAPSKERRRHESDNCRGEKESGEKGSRTDD